MGLEVGEGGEIVRLKTTGELVGDKFGVGSNWVSVGDVIHLCECYFVVTELHEDGISIEKHKAPEGAKG